MIGERQLALLRELAAYTAEARNRGQACERAAQALATNPYDLPFAMIYTVGRDPDVLTLVGSTGIDAGHPAAPPVLPLSEDCLWPVGAALARREPLFVSDLAKNSDTPRDLAALDAGGYRILIPAYGGSNPPAPARPPGPFSKASATHLARNVAPPGSRRQPEPVELVGGLRGAAIAGPIAANPGFRQGGCIPVGGKGPWRSPQALHHSSLFSRQAVSFWSSCRVPDVAAATRCPVTCVRIPT